VTTLEITVNGAAISYTDTGAGRPLLCLHGGMGIDGASLRVPGILDLAGHGVRVVIPDQRGHGRSIHECDVEYSHELWASDANALARVLGFSTLALLGHSYGGFIALEYAVRWPESLTHLVLVGTSAGPVTATSASVASASALRERFRSAWPHFFVGSDKHWPLFESLQFSPEPYNAAFTRELPAYDLRDRVATLDVPALLLVGAADHYRPAMEWLAGRMPNAELCVVDDAGHLPFIERANHFTSRVAAFLNQRM
jgi:proline iminopeptidase